MQMSVMQRVKDSQNIFLDYFSLTVQDILAPFPNLSYTGFLSRTNSLWKWRIATKNKYQLLKSATFSGSKEYCNLAKKGNQRNRISSLSLFQSIYARSSRSWKEANRLSHGGLIDNAPVTCSSFDRIHFIGSDRAAAAGAPASNFRPRRDGSACIHIRS